MTQRTLFLNHVGQTSQNPMGLEVERAEGVYIFSPDGQKYIDLIAGISVSSLGHSHPHVIAAIKAQIEKYMHVMVYGEYIQSPQVQLAARLAEVLPSPLESVFYTSSGSEATEGAMKLAKRATGRHQFVGFKSSYHGSTQGALSLMGDTYFRDPFRPLLTGITHLTYNNTEELSSITNDTAAVFVECVQAESGIIPADVDFIQAVRQRCSETGALMVIDEIQTAYGRTGSLFAMSQYNVVPDVLLLAKGFGGGLPLGAFIASKKLMNELTYKPVLGHINTFGGNPVCCAAGLAALEVLLEQPIINKVIEKAELFKSYLQHPKIKAVRNKGLIMAVELENADFNMKVIHTCLREGVLTDWFLFAPHCLRIAPPLIIKPLEIEQACMIICKAIDSI